MREAGPAPAVQVKQAGVLSEWPFYLEDFQGSVSWTPGCRTRCTSPMAGMLFLFKMHIFLCFVGIHTAAFLRLLSCR